MKSLLFILNEKNVNIGDYIQSLAARQFIKRKDEILYYDREQLHLYEGEEVKVVMNGWFMHHSENWPPSTKIYPLFRAFHINVEAYEKILSPENIQYLKQYEPIGCRDYDTVERLREKGVNAYFSSCLTTTLGYKYKDSEKTDDIFIVEPVHYLPEMSRRFQKYLFLFQYLFYFNGVSKYIKNLRRNCPDYIIGFSLKNFNRLACAVRSYLLIKQILTADEMKRIQVITQYYTADEVPDLNMRYIMAEDLVKRYAKASFVITSRIHCALPCLGLGTPVVFMQNEDDSFESRCRFKGLIDLFNVVHFKRDCILSKPDALMRGIINLKNKTSYMGYSRKLIEDCEKFFNDEA